MTIGDGVGARARGVTAAGLGLLLLAGGLTGLSGSGAVGFPVAAPSPSVRPALRASEPRVSTPASVDLNRADRMALATLPGIGPALADRIVSHREAHGPFRQPEDLLAVPGIGAKRLEQIRPLVRVSEGS